MGIVNAIILGVIQGVTEFLPISSSGHLVLIGKFIRIPTSASFIVFLHAGTLPAGHSPLFLQGY
ncbi:MAG: hypothetical protein GXO71_01505 [Caldiserica bacterium]|nr:hypothetical protein [Caldisericota bacterium]